MPQIQTIEGLHSLSQVQEMSQTFVPASSVDKAAYIAAVEAILKASEESPDHAVLAPAFRAVSTEPAPCSRKEDGSFVCRMRQMKLSEIVDAFRRGPDPEYFDLTSLRAAPADAFSADPKARVTFAMLAMIQQQLPTPMMTYALVGVGVIAVLGLGWYFLGSRGGRGLSSTHYGLPDDFSKRKCARFARRADGRRFCVKYKKPAKNDPEYDDFVQLPNRR